MHEGIIGVSLQFENQLYGDIKWTDFPVITMCTLQGISVTQRNPVALTAKTFAVLGNQSLKSRKKVQIIMIYVVKCMFLQSFFWTLNFDEWPFLSQLKYEKVVYLKRKSYYSLFLVKAVLFQLQWCGHLQDDGKPIFISDSNRFSMMYHLFQNSFRKLVKKAEREKQSIWVGFHQT